MMSLVEGAGHLPYPFDHSRNGDISVGGLRHLLFRRPYRHRIRLSTSVGPPAYARIFLAMPANWGEQNSRNKHTG